MQESDENYLTPSKMKPYFSKDCYDGFMPSSDKNFYKVYDALFKTLDKEEELEEEVGVKHFEPPAFGEHYACAEDVFKFYEDWSNFTTCK